MSTFCFVVLLGLMLSTTCVGATLKENCTPDVISEMGSILVRLKDNLQMLKSRDLSELLADTTLTVRLVAAHLQAAQRWLKAAGNETNDFKEVIDQLVKLCHDPFWSKIPMYNAIDRHVVSSELWDDAAKELIPGQLMEPKLQTCHELHSWGRDESGSPNENDSDFCISEIIKSNCNVSNECWYIETGPEPNSGYATSHRLLYLMVYTNMHCEVKDRSYVRLLKQKLCQQMLNECELIIRCGLSEAYLDLLAEDITFCGMEGFTEFAKPSWRKYVQQPTCRSRNKRTELMLKNGCKQHLTGVVTAALAFQLRYLTQLCVPAHKH